MSQILSGTISNSGFNPIAVNGRTTNGLQSYGNQSFSAFNANSDNVTATRGFYPIGSSTGFALTTSNAFSVTYPTLNISELRLNITQTGLSGGTPSFVVYVQHIDQDGVAYTIYQSEYIPTFSGVNSTLSINIAPWGVVSRQQIAIATSAGLWVAGGAAQAAPAASNLVLPAAAPFTATFYVPLAGAVFTGAQNLVLDGGQYMELLSAVTVSAGTGTGIYTASIQPLKPHSLPCLVSTQLNGAGNAIIINTASQIASVGGSTKVLIVAGGAGTVTLNVNVSGR